MIHPRWWLNGEPIQITRWTPKYHTFTLPISPLRPPQATQNPYLSPHRNEITTLGFQVLEARDNLTGYARIRYNTAATNAQQGLIEYAQELQEDNLHTRMPDIVKTSGWNRQFKSHDKTQKRLMTGVEAAERDANHREQAAAQEARLQSRDGYLLQRVPDTPPRRAPAEAALIASLQLRPDIEEEEEEEEEEVEEEEAFILPPSTAPAILSRAGRKRAPTMKALEAEKASKRGTGQGRQAGVGADTGEGGARGRGNREGGRGRGNRGGGRGRGSRGGRQGQRQ